MLTAQSHLFGYCMNFYVTQIEFLRNTTAAANSPVKSVAGNYMLFLPDVRRNNCRKCVYIYIYIYIYTICI